MTLSEAADKVIALARKIYDYYETELPKRHPNYPLVNPGEETAPPPPEEAELEAFLTSLPEETIYQLILIMHLGGGFYGVKDLAEYFDNLNNLVGDGENAVSELMGEKATLAEALSDGLEELRKRKVNVDKLPVTFPHQASVNETTRRLPTASA